MHLYSLPNLTHHSLPPKKKNPTHYSSQTWRGKFGVEKTIPDCWDPVAGLGCGAKELSSHHGSRGEGVPGPRKCAHAVQEAEYWPAWQPLWSNISVIHEGIQDRKETFSGFLFGGFTINWRNKQWQNMALWYIVCLKQISTQREKMWLPI